MPFLPFTLLLPKLEVLSHSAAELIPHGFHRCNTFIDNDSHPSSFQTQKGHAMHDLCGEASSSSSFTFLSTSSSWNFLTSAAPFPVLLESLLPPPGQHCVPTVDSTPPLAANDRGPTTRRSYSYSGGRCDRHNI